VGLSSSWAGGKDGREVIDCLLPSISCLLSDSGIFYLVTVKENRPDDICQYLMKSFGLFSQTVITRRAYNEHLSVLRFSKKKI
jgi:release factor glutamine methyltransferase